MEPAIGGAGAALPDWTQLPEEVLVTTMDELEIRDLIRSGAVCTSWHSSFAAFRRLRLPSPRQAPCLLYSGRSGATALYCPSTGATLRVPFRDLCGLLSSPDAETSMPDSVQPVVLFPLTTEAATPSFQNGLQDESAVPIEEDTGVNPGENPLHGLNSAPGSADSEPAPHPGSEVDPVSTIPDAPPVSVSPPPTLLPPRSAAAPTELPGSSAAPSSTGAGTVGSPVPAPGPSVMEPHVTTPRRRLSPIGSARGWLVVADEASDLHLANPLTGARVALPLITRLRCVEGGAADPDGGGGLVYRVRDERGVVAHIPTAEARDCVYDRAALSGSPLVAGGDCVVLLLHSPLGELSFARPGDELWTWVPPGERTGLRRGDFYRDAAYNDRDGLFYVVRSDDSIYALDLKGPNSPVVARRMMPELRHGDQPYRYLIHAPWGELLQAWRFRREYEPSSSTPVEIEDGDGDDVVADPSVELNTTELQLYKVDSREQRLVKLDGLRDYALFLGYNGSLCLPVKEFPGLKPNSAYVMDDSTEFMNLYKNNKREIGVWDIEKQSLQSLGDASPLPLKESWLNWPAPIWLTPSLL
ncbi:unnamed protein product [Urochloa decumbens]|uniref:KIB1-4 beta-propeller domain-containing protein n=1 Tax=Urochloa decumbens TaxID=240449 RepID=A0ABC9B1C5_9POAL